MTKVNGNNNVSAEYKIVNGKKVKKQEQSKNQKQVFNNKGQKTPQKPKDSAIKQEVYKKSGYQLKDTKDRNKIIQLKVNGKIRSYKTVGTLTTGGRILVQDAKGAYHVVSHTKDNKLIMLKDDYAKNKIFYESTSSEHKVKYGKKNYVITNSKRDRHGRMSAIDENGKRVVLSSDGKELKTGYVEAEDQKDNMNDYIAKQTKGKSKAEADKIRQQILSGNSSYSSKGVLRFKASNGEVWYYDTKRKTYVKYAEKEAQAIIKNLDKGATENWLLFRTGLGTDYELLKNTNAQIIDPEVLNKVNKHYSAEYGNKVDKNAQYGSGKYKTAYEAFLASEIGDDEVYQFNAALVKNNAITDQSRRNEILQTNLTKVGSRANRLAAADAASRKEDYQTLQDAAEEENKKKNYKAPFKGSDALQTYIYGVNNGDVQEIDDFNTTLIDPKEDMIDRDEIVKIKAETGALWAKKGKYDKAFEAQDGEIVDKMFALQDANGKASLNVKELKAKAKGFQGEYLMFAKPELFTEQELADKAVSMLTVALDQFDFIEKQNSLQSESVLHNLSHSRSDVVASAMSDNGTKNASKNAIEASISKAYTLIRNDKVLNLVKQKMGDKFNLLQKKEQAMFKTNTFANVTTKNDNVKSNLSAEEVAQNKYVVSWLKNQLEDLERDKKLNEQKEGWKQTAVDAMRTSLRAGETRESLANKYDLIKSNMARLEAAAEGKLVDKNGKPVSFEDAMKNLGETGIKALEKANQDYQSAQATGEFVVDMAVLALPLPKGFNAANTVIKMGNAFYKVISKSDKVCKVIKITQEAIKGSKIYEVATKVATTNPKLVENTRKVATIMNSSATGAMHMAGKTVALDASNIATSREGFTSDRISEMNTKTQSAAVFGGMGGAIGGTTAVASEFVSSAGAKYAVHGVGLVADLMGAAGLMTAESHGETNFWDNLRCVNPDGSFNFEQASMTAMMIFGHLHGMSAIKGKPMPKAEIQADGTVKGKSTPKAEIQADDTVKYTLNNRELVLSKDGIFTDSETGRKFKLATNKNGKAELTELTKKEVAARHSEAPAEESRGTSTQQIKSFKERINNAKTREELQAIRSEIKNTDLTVQERNELMAESLKVQSEWGQAPERSQIVNMATEGEASGMGKSELTALRNEVGIKQSKPGLHFEGETDGANTVINEMKGNDTVNSYIVSRDVEGNAHIEYKVSYENGKATDVEFYDADGTIKKLPAEKKQAVLEELNKPAETDPTSHSELVSESNQPVAEQQLLKPAESDVKYEPLTTNEPIVVKARANSLVKDFGIKHTVEGSEFDMMGGDSLVEYKGSGIGDDILKTYNFTFDEQGRPFLRESSENISWHGEKYTIYRDAHENITEIQHEGEYYKPKNTENGVTYVNEHGIVDDFNYILKKSNQPATDKSVVADESRVTTETESNQPATDKSVVAEESRVTTETPQKTEQTPVNASESEANQIKPETKATDTKSDKSTGEKSQVKIEQKNNKEFSTSDIPVELSEMEEYVKNLNVVEFPENENTYTYSIKNDKTGKLMYVRFNNKNSKRSSITIVEANKQEQHIEFTKDGENPTKVTYKDADGNIIKYAEYEYNKNNQITKGTERNADGSLKGSSEYEYDGNDKLVKLTNKDADGKVIESRELKYNDAGKLTEQIEKDAEGKITGVFDGDGNPLEIPTGETPTANDKNSVNASEGEAIQQKNRFTDNKQMSSEKIVADKTPINELNNSELESKINPQEKVDVSPADQSATGKTAEEAEQTNKEEMNNNEPTSTAQVKNLEKYDIMFQSKEGKALLDNAKKDPNFGKTVEERVPSDKIVKDADGNIQSIEIDGVTYTRNEQGEYVNEKGDSQIQIETPDQDTFIIDPKVDKRITIDKENNKILRINSDGMTIEYDSNGQPKEVSVLGGKSIDLSTGNYSPDYGDINVDPTGRVIKNDAFFIDINGRKYYPNKQEGYRYSDWGENAKGESIDYKIRKETEDSLSKQIEDAQLETKKAYDDVRNQIEDAYNNSKIDRNAADNLHAELNKKAKANGLETQETPTMKAEREALAKWNEQVDALKNNLMSEIEKVDSQASHDQMVERIGEACKNGEIDMKRANELYDALKAKAESLGNVESLAQKAERINAELKAHEIKSATADAKPSKISMFDRLFHRNKARLEKEVASGEKTIGDYKFNTVKDENGYVRTKTNNTGKIEGKEYFNAKGKKIKTEVYYDNGNIKELTEGNVTTKYYANKNVHTVVYPNHKTVEFVYDENGNLTAKYTEEISKAREFARSITAEENEFGEYEYDTIKRRTNYTYNSKKDRFELLNDKKEVVGTATFDPETRHWVEDGQYSSDLAPKTTNVSRGEGRFRIKLPERNKVPKNLRDENGKLREGVTQNDKGYIESITKDEVTTTKKYDSKGTLVSETTENLTTYYNKNGKVIYTEEKLPDDKGVKITEKTKDYDLEIIEKDGSLKIIHHTKNENGTAKGTEEFKYSEKNNVYENKGPEGTVLKSVEYDADKHSWTIRDGEGKKLDSQNNMKESHIKRNIGIGAGVLAVGGVALYEVSKLVKSDDDKEVKQSDNPAIAEQVAKTIAKQAANAKAETKVTLDGKEGTIAEDGTLTLDGKPYPKAEDGTYTIGDKKYKVEDGKLVEVVDTPDDNGETGGADGTDGTAEVKGTVDGKEYTIHSDGSATIGGHQYDKLEDGYYHTEDGSIYGVGEDGKLVKIDKTQAGSDGSQAGSAGSATQTGNDSAQAGSAGSATQTGSDSAQAGSAGATSQQTGNTNTTGNNTHVTAPAQPADSSASTRTTGTTHNDTSVTTRHTNVPAEESRVNSSRPSEQSAESRHTGNTSVTGATEPTDEQKQVAKTLQDEISNIANAEDVLGFTQKIYIAVSKGQITPQQAEDLSAKVETYVKTFDNVSQGLDEQNHTSEPEFGLGKVTTPQEPQPKEKQEITPMERMELTEKIRKAMDRKDIEEIQQEMRKYKVFPGRKNLRRAYKAKLRAIKHQDEPQKVEKYNKKFKKRMEKIENSKVYEQDTKEILINNEFKIDKKMWDSENFYT